MVAGWLVFMSAAIIFALGALHLWITFHGPKLKPRDPSLEARLKEVSPVITRQTTMWKAWIGFNASHSYGAILFGLIYGYLALAHRELLFGSAYLAAVGALLLAGYVVLGRLYWFSIPFRGIVIATILYIAGFAFSRA